MRHQYKPQQPNEIQELVQPREARPSGAIRIAPDADVPGEDEQTLRLGFPITRPNAPLPYLPSMLVDAHYLQAVSSIAGRMRKHRRNLAVAASFAFLCGALALPLTVGLVRRIAAPVTASVPASGVVKDVGVSLQTPPVPMSAAPDSEPPRRTRFDQRDAARQVHGAQELRRAGRVQDARRLLNDVLKDRSGYPPALAAMAELELDRGKGLAAVRWARLTVRALPSSVAYRDLLGRAYTAAGLHAESARAHARATQLYMLQQ